MKILYIHHNPDKGGSSNSLRIVLEILKDKPDCEIVVSCPMGEAFNRFQKLGIETIPSPIPYFFSTTAGVSYTGLRLLSGIILGKKHLNYYQNLIIQIKPDIVHLNEIGLIHYAKLAKSIGCKVVMHARIAASHTYPSVTRKVTNYIHKYVDRLIAIDESVIASLPNLDLKKSKVVYNPFYLSEEIKEMGPKQIDTKVFKVIFLSNFLKHKGIIEVLNSAVILKDRKEIMFLIAGANVKAPDFYRSLKGRLLDFFGIYPNMERRIKKIIEKHQLTNIKLLGDIAYLHDFLSSADLLVMPTLMNEPSRAIFEAGIYRVPSIISLRNKIEDIVKDGYNGFIVNEKSPQQIADSILILADNRQLCTSMGNNARKRFMQMNDAQLSADKILNIYNQIV